MIHLQEKILILQFNLEVTAFQLDRFVYYHHNLNCQALNVFSRLQKEWISIDTIHCHLQPRTKWHMLYYI